MKTALLALAALLTFPLHAQDLSGYERVLYPIVAWPNGVTGVGGSMFSAINTLFAADRDVRVFPKYDESGAATFHVVPAGVSDPTIFCCAPSRLGRVLYVEKDSATAVASTVIARDASGVLSITSMPVVRERDFRTSRTNIIDIVSFYSYAPTSQGNCRAATPQFRHRLRIYDPDATGSGVVRVRIWDGDVNPPVSNPISEVTLTLNQREGSDPSYPAFAELPIPEICHPYSCQTPCMGGTQRVEIEPLTPGLRFWAFVSGTDNLSQRVVVNWPE